MTKNGLLWREEQNTRFSSKIGLLWTDDQNKTFSSKSRLLWSNGQNNTTHQVAALHWNITSLQRSVKYSYNFWGPHLALPNRLWCEVKKESQNLNVWAYSTRIFCRRVFLGIHSYSNPVTHSGSQNRLKWRDKSLILYPETAIISDFGPKMAQNE